MQHLAKGAAVLVFLACPFLAQQSTGWRDPSPHKIQFVTVDENARLEVLDWGGSGRPLDIVSEPTPTVCRRC